VLLIAWLIIDIFLKKYIFIGDLKLMNDIIIAEEGEVKKEILLDSVSNLKVMYGGYNGQNFDSFIIGTLRSKDGFNNYIEFEHNGTRIKYEFYINSNSKALHKLVSLWQNTSADVKFFNEFEKEIKSL